MGLSLQQFFTRNTRYYPHFRLLYWGILLLESWKLFGPPRVNGTGYSLQGGGLWMALSRCPYKSRTQMQYNLLIYTYDQRPINLYIILCKVERPMSIFRGFSFISLIISHGQFAFFFILLQVHRYFNLF